MTAFQPYWPAGTCASWVWHCSHCTLEHYSAAQRTALASSNALPVCQAALSRSALAGPQLSCNKLSFASVFWSVERWSVASRTVAIDRRHRHQVGLPVYYSVGRSNRSIVSVDRSNRSVGRSNRSDRSVQSIDRSVGRIGRSVGRSIAVGRSTRSIGRSVGRIGRSNRLIDRLDRSVDRPQPSLEVLLQYKCFTGLG